MSVNQVPPPEPASFASLSRRISGWTTNLLATALVAVLALAVGRQLITWWRVEPGSGDPANGANASPGTVALADLSAGQTLELGFGTLPYQLQCRTLRGDQAAAVEALSAACRELAAGAPPLAGLGPAEEQLLAVASQAEPSARGPGSIELFAAPQGMPLVVVTAAFAEQPAKTDPPAALLPPLDQQIAPVASDQPAAAEREPKTVAAKPVGASRRRVVTWGLAASAQAGEWSLYIAHAGHGRLSSPRPPDTATSSGTTSPSAATTEPAHPGPSSTDMVPIPPGSQRSLSLEDAQGGGLIAFGGSGRPDEWTAFYADWFGRHGWQPVETWQPAAGRWHARYRHSGASPATVDVQFGPSGNGLLGLISITAARRAGGP